MRNHVSKKAHINMIEYARRYHFEVWSYNKDDCDEYGLSYNPQVLDRRLFHDVKKEDIVYTAVFIGNEKGRLAEISSLKKELDRFDRPSYFYIHDYDKKAVEKKHVEKFLMPYNDYLNIVNQSEAIIDLVNKNNWGLTIRPLEAMFAKKKLITNYTDIVSYDFYRKENIFILNENNRDEIAEWLKIPYQQLPENILEQYDIDAWLGRFGIINEDK